MYLYIAYVKAGQLCTCCKEEKYYHKVKIEGGEY